MRKKLLALCLFLSACIYTSAQIEVARLSTKGFSAIGFGAFLNVAIPVAEGGSAVTAEAAFYYFKKDDINIACVPFLLGYRYTFDGTGTGFYAEPFAGYNIGATDIQKYDENGTPLYNDDGSEVNQKVKGVVAGTGIGYILPGSFALNIGLRYQHIFVSGGDPALNTFSLRFSYPFSFGRKEY